MHEGQVLRDLAHEDALGHELDAALLLDGALVAYLLRGRVRVRVRVRVKARGRVSVGVRVRVRFRVRIRVRVRVNISPTFSHAHPRTYHPIAPRHPRPRHYCLDFHPADT